MPTEITATDFEREVQELAAYCGDLVTVTDWSNARNLHCSAYRMMVGDRDLREHETWRLAVNKRDWARLIVQHRLGQLTDAETRQLAAQLVGMPTKPGAKDDVMITHSLSEQFNQALDAKVEAYRRESITIALERKDWERIYGALFVMGEAFRDDLGGPPHEDTESVRQSLASVDAFFAAAEAAMPGIEETL